MKLTAILEKNCVCVPMKATDKESAITELVDLLGESGQLADREQVLSAVLQREKTASTGIGHGLAVPHGKSAGCRKLVMAIGKPSPPMDFGAKDGKPVEFIVLLASPPDQTGPHIQALARISRLMLTEEFRVAMSRASSSDELWQVIVEYE